MAKKPEPYYIVPMQLEQAQARLEGLSVLGIGLDFQAAGDDAVSYLIQRLGPRRRGRRRVFDETQGQMRPWETDLTRVEPHLVETVLWKLLLFYLLSLLLGIVAGLMVGIVAEGALTLTVLRITAAVLVVYVPVFWLVQPQRWFFRGSDSRLGDFVKAVLNGPYADPANLYELFFPGLPYWELHLAEIAPRNRQQ
jgi:ABC-type sugar transport system permease subunit